MSVFSLSPDPLIFLGR